MNRLAIAKAANIILQGGVIAYPTEAVFGLGCDPLNENAILRILQIKERDPHKGLILVAASIEEVLPFIDAKKVPLTVWKTIEERWPGPFTYVMPCSSLVSSILSGGRQTIAVRVSNNPVVKALCLQANMALVSTSCNRSGSDPIKTAESVEIEFGNRLDYVVHEAVGGLDSPTEIVDALTGKIIRPAVRN
jgi:L-threonylcarbamoyladenylate synthase